MLYPQLSNKSPQEMARPRPLQLKPKTAEPNDGILNLVTNMEKHVQMLTDRYSSLDVQNGCLFTKNGCRAAVFDSSRAVKECLAGLSRDNTTKAERFNKFYVWVCDRNGFLLQLNRFRGLKHIGEMAQNDFQTFKHAVFAFCAQGHIEEACPEIAGSQFWQVFLRSITFIVHEFHKKDYTLFYYNTFHFLTPQDKSWSKNQLPFTKFAFPGADQDVAW